MPDSGNPVAIRVDGDADIVEARRVARSLAGSIGFSSVDIVVIATAISEIARNMVDYGHGGVFELAIVERNDRVQGLRVTARDSGPGIVDVELAMQDGYSTGGGLGLGLPGAKRLMDDFSLETEVGKGTTISMTKWRG